MGLSAINECINNNYHDTSNEVNEQHIIDMFRISKENQEFEEEAENVINKIIKDFLLSENVNSSAELKEVINNFECSRIPNNPINLLDYLKLLNDNVIAHATHVSSPRFIGHMTSSLPYFMKIMGKLLVSLNQNLVKAETSKVFTPYERQSLAMMHRLIYNFPEEFYDKHIQDNNSTLGIITSGGTIANLTALWCARNACLPPEGDFKGVEKEGLYNALLHYNYTGAVIIGPETMHYSFDKAADMLGIGEKNLIRVHVDNNNHIDLAELESTILKCKAQKKLIIAIVGVAGATDSGSIDPINDMADVANSAGIHFHVDAAWGGALIFSEKYKYKLAGLEKADSVTIDGHKQLYLPMGIGMVFFKNNLLAGNIEKNAQYIIRAGSFDLGRRSVEGSRSGTSLYLHTALHVLGLKGYEVLINEGITKAYYMADSIRSRPEFELLSYPETNILVYRFIPEEFRMQVKAGQVSRSENNIIDKYNETLQRTQRKVGKFFNSRTKVKTSLYGRGVQVVAIRSVIANPLTMKADIDAVLEDIIRISKVIVKD